MAKKRKPDPDAPIQDPQTPDVLVEDPAAPEPEEKPTEASATLTLRGPESSVRRAAGKLGAANAAPRNGDAHEEDPAPEPDDDYTNKFADMLADGRNMVIVTRDFPTRYEGQKVKPIKLRLNCPVTIDRLSSEIFENYGGQVFRIAIYPNTPSAEAKQPLGAFTLENPDTDQPWEPEDEGGAGGPAERFEPDPFSREDKSPGAVTQKALEEEAAAIKQEIEVKRLKRMRREALRDDDEVRENPADDRVRVLEERITIRDVETRMEKRMEEVLRAVQESRAPKDDGTKLLIEIMRSNDLKFSEMMKAQSESSNRMMQMMMQGNKKEDPFESLEKIARLKTLFGGDNDRVNELYNVALERLLDPDRGSKDDGGGADESDLKYAINKLEPLIQKFVDKRIEDSGKPKKEYTKEEILALQYEAAQKVAQELQAKWAAEGKVLDVRGLPAPGAPPPGPKPPGAPPATPKPNQEGSMKPPPAPNHPQYDRKLAVNFILDVAIEDIKRGRPDNSFLPWDIFDSLDSELLEEFSKVDSGAQLDSILSKWGDPARVEFVKELGRNDPLVKTWLSRVVSTAQEIILKNKAEKKTEPAKS